MKNLLRVTIVVLANIAVSIAIAIAFASYVPVKEGVIVLEKDYQSYSNDELRRIAKDNMNHTAENSNFADLIRGRGTFFQAVFWLFGLILVVQSRNLYLLGSTIGIVTLLFVGWFRWEQALVILVSLFLANVLYSKLKISI